MLARPWLEHDIMQRLELEATIETAKSVYRIDLGKVYSWLKAVQSFFYYF